MTHTTTNTLEIQAPVAKVYAYVTQPWRWHEWHPSSKSATESKRALVVEDTFDEVVEVQPFAPLPINLQRQTHYTVLAAEPGKLWEVRGQMRDAWLQIRYEFSSTASGTQFTRTLIYAASGSSRLLMPLLKRRMAAVSVIALANLRGKLESSSNTSSVAELLAQGEADVRAGAVRPVKEALSDLKRKLEK